MMNTYFEMYPFPINYMVQKTTIYWVIGLSKINFRHYHNFCECSPGLCWLFLRLTGIVQDKKILLCYYFMRLHTYLSIINFQFKHHIFFMIITYFNICIRPWLAFSDAFISLVLHFSTSPCIACRLSSVHSEFRDFL